MVLNKDVSHMLRELEESLWKRETRFDESYMKDILADNFLEFGRSGKVYTKEDSLAASEQDIKARLPLEKLSINSIDENTVLITYVSKVQYDELEVSNRSSLWIKTAYGWRLRFHQGTAVKH